MESTPTKTQGSSIARKAVLYALPSQDTMGPLVGATTRPSRRPTSWEPMQTLIIVTRGALLGYPQKGQARMEPGLNRESCVSPWHLAQKVTLLNEHQHPQALQKIPGPDAGRTGAEPKSLESPTTCAQKIHLGPLETGETASS
jgi:hypothetical protein